MRKLLTKPINILAGKILRNVYCFNIKCFTIIFKNGGKGGGGESMLPKTLHEKI